MLGIPIRFSGIEISFLFSSSSSTFLSCNSFCNCDTNPLISRCNKNSLSTETIPPPRIHRPQRNFILEGGIRHLRPIGLQSLSSSLSLYSFCSPFYLFLSL
ncbi:hypothetical protein L1887_05413 [Cichorium endivia]|nr:hypothetical protein L1887_05413 [Cichorium endivia]